MEGSSGTVNQVRKKYPQIKKGASETAISGCPNGKLLTTNSSLPQYEKKRKEVNKNGRKIFERKIR